MNIMVNSDLPVAIIGAGPVGDRKAAREVQLVVPETGVCSAAPLAAIEAAGCCGGPAPTEVDACCAKDADAKVHGETGCGCGTGRTTSKTETREPRAVGSDA